MIGDPLACRISLFFRNGFLSRKILPAKFRFDHYPPPLPALLVRPRLHRCAVCSWRNNRGPEFLTVLRIALSLVREQLRRFHCFLCGLRFLARAFLYISHGRSLL